MSVIFDRIKETAKQYPDKTAIIDENGSALTYLQLLQRVEIRIRQLLNTVTPSLTRVALCLQEGVEIPITVLALNTLRVPIIPLNTGLQIEQILHLLKSVDADLVILDPTTASLFKSIQKSIKYVDLSELRETTESGQLDIPRVKESNDYKHFLITLSSGSTGNPKPIVLSEKNKLDRADQAILLYETCSDDVILCASPFFHTLGQRLSLLPLLVGATLVQLTRFTAENWSKAVEEHGVTFTIPVSSHMHELVEPLLASPKRFRTLRCLVSSSAAINEGVKKQLFETLSCDFHEMYGASEIATATNLNRRQAALKPRSVGVSCPGVKIRIVDENFADCRPMAVGQIIVKSPLASAGYYHLPETTEESFVDDFFLTGDLGYLDEEGYLFFVDRKKDVIITGGMNIYPSDIESVISEHQLIKECAVVGIHDPFLGEVPVAVVVCLGVVRTVEREMRSMAQQKLAACQRPMKYFFRENLPLNASGKVDKKLLRKELNVLKLDLSSKLRALQQT
jgi:acyl-CoA synthetase (AMP-forming)/AMP-acid ligase II